jgi:hypothetical protein
LTVPVDELIADDIPADYQEQETQENGSDPAARQRTIVIDSDITNFIKKPKTAKAREYEQKTAGILNIGMRLSAQNPATVADAAAFIVYGAGVSAAAGELADESDKAAMIIDAVASPNSPYVAFAMALFPLVAQLMRNHEKETEVAARRVIRRNVKLPFRKTPLSIRIPLRVRLPKRFRSQTADPKVIAQTVFTNEDVKKALKRRGIDVAWPGL